MENYITKIANREAIFTEDSLKVGYLDLSYEKMSNIKFRNGENSGFMFEYEGRTVLIPCSLEEKDKMMPFFSKAVLLEIKRKEKEQEEDALETLNFLTIELPKEPINNSIEETQENLDINSNSDINLQEDDFNSILIEKTPIIEPKIEEKPLDRIETENFQLDIVQTNENLTKEMPIESAQVMPTQIELPQNYLKEQYIQQEIKLPEQELNREVVNNTKENQNIIEDKKKKPIVFWSIGRLIMGILAIIVVIFITFQAYKSGVINILITNKTFISNLANNLIIAICMFFGGILGIITSKSSKKLGCIFTTLLFSLGVIYGALNWNSNYGNIRIWSAVSLVFVLFYLFCTIMNPRKIKS